MGILYGRVNPRLLDDVLSLRDQIELPDPEVGPPFNTAESFAGFLARYDISPFSPAGTLEFESAEAARRRHNIMAQLVDALYRKPSRAIALDILLLGLGDNDELRRVASAISLLDILSEVSAPIGSLISTLDAAQSDLARTLAEAALHRLGNIQRRPASTPIVPDRNVGNNKAALIVHGSRFGWAGQQPETWWRPGSPFHNFIKEKFCPELYSQQDHFVWSGGWSDTARELAAKDLVSWTRNRNLKSLNILSHSHGCNVVMKATHLGLNVGSAVFMSCPVHWDLYQPDFSNLEKAISYQVHLDLVILADRGAFRFNHPKIEDQWLPRWFWSHYDSYDEKIWKNNGLTF